MPPCKTPFDEMKKTLIFSVLFHSTVILMAVVLAGSASRREPVFWVEIKTPVMEKTKSGGIENAKKTGKHMASGKKEKDGIKDKSVPLEGTRKKEPEDVPPVFLRHPAQQVFTLSGGAEKKNAAGSGSTSTGDADEGTGIRKAGHGPQAEDFTGPIRASIERAVRYPLPARKRKIEGTVLVSFDINAAGSPLNIRVIKSSGHAILDDEAASAIRRAAPLPYLSGALKIPISFRLVR